MEVSPPLRPHMQASKKPKAKSGERIFGYLDFYWLSPDLSLDSANEAKLIFYPQYPETRLSGFLRGSQTVPSKYLREKSGEVFNNRLLFLGTDRQLKTIGFLAVGHQDLLDEVRSTSTNLIGIESNIGWLHRRTTATFCIAKNSLQHDGTRLKDGICIRVAPQAVGFTLEALLGIAPNSDNAPDYEGYEVKALTVQKPGPAKP